jgi:hypothetical protein
MHQGSNTILILEVPDVDLTGKQVYATFKALNGKTFTKTEPELDISAHEIAVHFNQSDTLGLPEGPLRVQVRWIEEDGNTGYSDIATIQIEGVMYREPIVYEEDSEE